MHRQTMYPSSNSLLCPRPRPLQSMREEASRLSKASFGPEMLQAIGYMYSRLGAKVLFFLFFLCPCTCFFLYTPVHACAAPRRAAAAGPRHKPCSLPAPAVAPQELGKNFTTLGVGWAWEALRGVGHGTKTTFGAVSGIVGMQVGAVLLLLCLHGEKVGTLHAVGCLLAASGISFTQCRASSSAPRLPDAPAP